MYVPVYTFLGVYERVSGGKENMSSVLTTGSASQHIYIYYIIYSIYVFDDNFYVGIVTVMESRRLYEIVKITPISLNYIQ